MNSSVTRAQTAPNSSETVEIGNEYGLLSTYVLFFRDLYVLLEGGLGIGI